MRQMRKAFFVEKGQPPEAAPRRCGLFFFAAQQQYPGKRKGKRRRISLRGFG
jgi:ribosomal protein S6E (S10)